MDLEAVWSSWLAEFRFEAKIVALCLHCVARKDRVVDCKVRRVMVLTVKFELIWLSLMTLLEFWHLVRANCWSGNLPYNGRTTFEHSWANWFITSIHSSLMKSCDALSSVQCVVPVDGNTSSMLFLCILNSLNMITRYLHHTFILTGSWALVLLGFIAETSKVLLLLELKLLFKLAEFWVWALWRMMLAEDVWCHSE